MISTLGPPGDAPGQARPRRREATDVRRAARGRGRGGGRARRFASAPQNGDGRPVDGSPTVPRSFAKCRSELAAGGPLLEAANLRRSESLAASARPLWRTSRRLRTRTDRSSGRQRRGLGSWPFRFQKQGQIVKLDLQRLRKKESGKSLRRSSAKQNLRIVKFRAADSDCWVQDQHCSVGRVAQPTRFRAP